MLITEEYRRLNRGLYNSSIGYGLSGHSSSRFIFNLIVKNNLQSLLDYGCGQETLWYGRTKKGIKYIGLKEMLLNEGINIDYYGYDPVFFDEGNIPDKNYNIVTCTEVMEHIEPECLENVLYHIFLYSNKIIYFLISSDPARKILSDGRNAHLIQEPKEWWVKKIKPYANAYIGKYQFEAYALRERSKSPFVILIKKEDRC